MAKKSDKKKRASLPAAAGPESGRPLAVAIFSAIILHALFIFVFPEISNAMIFQRTWGFHFIYYFPLPVILMFYAVAIACAFPPTNRKIASFWEQHIWPHLLNRGKINKYIIFGIMSILFVPVCYLLRAKYGLLGDNFLRVSDLTTGKIIGQEWGTSHIYGAVYRLLNGFFGTDARESIVYFNCFIGAFYAFTALLTADTLGRTNFQKGVYWSGIMSVAIVQYFFGYLEIYGFITVLIMLYVWSAVLAARGRLPVLVPALFVGAAFIAHLMIVTFIPALLYLFYRNTLCRWALFRNRNFIIAVSLAALPVMYFIYAKFVRGHNLIYFPNEMYSYAMFTGAHVWEYLNGQIQAAPVAFIMLPQMLAMYLKHKKSIDLTGRFLGIAAFFTTFNAFYFNAVRGAADWDVLCVAGLPITLFMLYLLFSAYDIPYIRIQMKYIVTVFVVFSALHAFSWIVLNATDLSIPRKIDITENDPAEYYANESHPPAMNLAIEFNSNGLDAHAEYWYREAIRRHAQDPRHYYNLATFLLGSNRIKEASQLVIDLFQKFPGYPAQYSITYDALMAAGRRDFAILAEEQFLTLAESYPDSFGRYFTGDDLMQHRARLALNYVQHSDWVNAEKHLARFEALNIPLNIDGRPIGELLSEIRAKIRTSKP